MFLTMYTSFSLKLVPYVVTKTRLISEVFLLEKLFTVSMSYTYVSNLLRQTLL